MSSNPRMMNYDIHMRLCLECFKSGWLWNTGCRILLFLTSDLPESYLICLGLAEVKEKWDDSLGGCPLTSVDVVFLLCVLSCHAGTHLLVGLQFLCPILMQWDFTAILVPDCCHEQCNILQLVSLKMSLELRIHLKGNQSSWKKDTDCTDQSSVLIGMLAVCHRLWFC